MLVIGYNGSILIQVDRGSQVRVLPGTPFGARDTLSRSGRLADVHDVAQADRLGEAAGGGVHPHRVARLDQATQASVVLVGGATIPMSCAEFRLFRLPRLQA